MLEGLLWCKSLIHFPLKALINKVNKQVILTFHHFTETFGIWEPNSAFGVWILKWSIVIIKKDLSSRSEYNHGPWWYSFNLHNTLYLFFLIFSCENRKSYIQLVENAAEGPHVNSWSIPDAHHDLRGSVKPTLNVGVKLIRLISATSKINHFNPTFVWLPQKDILWLHVAMDDVVLFHVVK
jgi:hypothetical protein